MRSTFSHVTRVAYSRPENRLHGVGRKMMGHVDAPCNSHYQTFETGRIRNVFIFLDVLP